MPDVFVNVRVYFHSAIHGSVYRMSNPDSISLGQARRFPTGSSHCLTLMRINRVLSSDSSTVSRSVKKVPAIVISSVSCRI